MIGWFVRWFERFVAFGLELAAQLVRGLLRAPVTGAKRMVEPVRVRRARDAEEILPLRHAVLRAGRPFADARFGGDDDPRTRHWVAEHDGRVVGVVSVMPADEPDGRGMRWQLRGMAVDPEWQGRRVGQRLLRAVHAEVAEPMWCNARERAARFYAREGWTRVAGPFDIPGVGPHFRMVRTP